MGRTAAMRDLRMARFAEVYERWVSREITQVKAASLLAMSARTFRRYAARYKEMGLKGLDRRSPFSSPGTCGGSRGPGTALHGPICRVERA